MNSALYLKEHNQANQKNTVSLRSTLVSLFSTEFIILFWFFDNNWVQLWGRLKLISSLQKRPHNDHFVDAVLSSPESA